MRDRLEHFFLEVVENRRQGPFIAVLKGGLWLLSLVYYLVIQARQLFFRLHLFPSRSVTAWVISVGNITVGGTGKTPVVERLARLLHAHGRKVAIVSRGYRRSTGPWLVRLKEKLLGAPTTRLVSDGQRMFLTSRVAGDEPYLLASNLEGIAVLVNRRRAKGALYAAKRLKADTIILDDGFQHLGLKRDLDIVLVDSQCPFGNRHLIPRGILREPPRNLERADIILITKAELGQTQSLKQSLARFNPRAEIMECRHKPLFLRDLRTSLKASLAYLQDTKIYSVAGIARPEGFEKLLIELGAVVVKSRRFADHHFYISQEMIDLMNEAWQMGAEAIVTTEKDAARFPLLPPSGLPVYSLRVEVETVNEAENFDQSLLRLLRDREKGRRNELREKMV
jgi:tetraacyldisaccharide 4'-kinase